MAFTKQSKSVPFRSRYAGLTISKSKSRRDEKGNFVPGVSIKFVDYNFSTDDPEIVAFLESRDINGVKQYGVDYWRAEESEKFINRVPKHRQQAEIMRVKDDTITALRAELAASKGK